MRKLPLPLIVLLLALFAVASPAQALSLSSLPIAPLAAPDEEADEAEGDEEGEAEESDLEEPEDCEFDEETEEENCEETEEGEGEECILKDAQARVAASPANNTVRLTIHYKAFAPAAVSIKAKLRGSKGGLNLGASKARFRRAGAFHDSIALSEKRMEKALAARKFAIDLQALNTPGYCRFHLTAQRGGGKRLWS
jgi:hypothetical protein